MKRITFKIVALALALPLFTACGGSGEASDAIKALEGLQTELENMDLSSGDEMLTDDAESDDASLEMEEPMDEDAPASDADAALDEYEGFVDKYVELLKKTKEGDMSAMGEYAEYMQKANDATANLAASAGEMTPEQLTRWQEIQKKMSDAATSLAQ